MATISLSRKALRMGKAGVPVNDWNDLITVLNAIVTLNTDLKTQYAALLAKLDADGGVTDTDYAATVGTTAATPDSLALVK